MRAALLLIVLVLWACPSHRGPPHARVLLRNCRCAEMNQTVDPSPLLALDATGIEERPLYRVLIIDRSGRLRGSGNAIRDGPVVPYQVIEHLAPGHYFVRLDAEREYLLIVESSPESQPVRYP